MQPNDDPKSIMTSANQNMVLDDRHVCQNINRQRILKVANKYDREYQISVLIKLSSDSCLISLGI